MNYKTLSGEPITLGRWYEVRHSGVPGLKPAVVLFTGDVCSGFSHGGKWIEDYLFKNRLIEGDVLREVNMREIATFIWEQFKKMQGSMLTFDAEHPLLDRDQVNDVSMNGEYGYGLTNNGGVIVLGRFDHLGRVLPVFVENSFSSFVFQSDYRPLLEYGRSHYKIGDWCMFGTGKYCRCISSSEFKVKPSKEPDHEIFGGFRIVCGTDIIYSEAKGWVEKCKPNLPKGALVKAWREDSSVYVIGEVQNVDDDTWSVKVGDMWFGHACTLTDSEKQEWINRLIK